MPVAELFYNFEASVGGDDPIKNNDIPGKKYFNYTDYDFQIGVLRRDLIDEYFKPNKNYPDAFISDREQLDFVFEYFRFHHVSKTGERFDFFVPVDKRKTVADEKDAFVRLLTSVEEKEGDLGLAGIELAYSRSDLNKKISHEVVQSFLRRNDLIGDSQSLSIPLKSMDKDPDFVKNTYYDLKKKLTNLESYETFRFSVRIQTKNGGLEHLYFTISKDNEEKELKEAIIATQRLKESMESGRHYETWRIAETYSSKKVYESACRDADPVLEKNKQDDYERNLSRVVGDTLKNNFPGAYFDEKLRASTLHGEIAKYYVELHRLMHWDDVLDEAAVYKSAAEYLYIQDQLDKNRVVDLDDLTPEQKKGIAVFEKTLRTKYSGQGREDDGLSPAERVFINISTKEPITPHFFNYVFPKTSESVKNGVAEKFIDLEKFVIDSKKNVSDRIWTSDKKAQIIFESISAQVKHEFLHHMDCLLKDQLGEVRYKEAVGFLENNLKYTAKLNSFQEYKKIISEFREKYAPQEKKQIYPKAEFREAEGRVSFVRDGYPIDKNISNVVDHSDGPYHYKSYQTMDGKVSVVDSKGNYLLSGCSEVLFSDSLLDKLHNVALTFSIKTDSNVEEKFNLYFLRQKDPVNTYHRDIYFVSNITYDESKHGSLAEFKELLLNEAHTAFDNEKKRSGISDSGYFTGKDSDPVFLSFFDGDKKHCTKTCASLFKTYEQDKTFRNKFYSRENEIEKEI